jgi:hypothetical protein
MNQSDRPPDVAGASEAQESMRAPEGPDVQLGLPIAIGAIVLLLVIVAMAASGWLLLRGRMPASMVDHAPPAPSAFLKQPTPAPHLQDNPARDLKALREREQRRLSSYGWVDRQANIVHIPIDRAVDLIVENGLPAELGSSRASGRGDEPFEPPADQQP